MSKPHADEIEVTADRLLQAIRAAAAKNGASKLDGQISIELKMGDSVYIALGFVGQTSQGSQGD